MNIDTLSQIVVAATMRNHNPQWSNQEAIRMAEQQAYLVAFTVYIHCLDGWNLVFTRKIRLPFVPFNGLRIAFCKYYCCDPLWFGTLEYYLPDDTFSLASRLETSDLKMQEAIDLYLSHGWQEIQQMRAEDESPANATT